MHGGFEAIEIVFLLLLTFVTAFALLARKLDTPYPIVLVIAGLGLGLVPGVPRVRLNPDVIFLAILPPLLYAAAWQTSWREFRYNFISIFLLAFGLVGFVVAVIAVAAPRLLPEFDWRTGFVLGAVVSTTDAIAATAIARRLSLPQRIVDVLEGESLINDATGLLALEFGTALVMNGQQPTVGGGLLRLSWLIAGGLAVGLLLGIVVTWLERRIDDGPIEITLGLCVPYAAYLAAEAVHASGVLAVVACGLWLSRQSAGFFSPGVRLQTWAVWEALTFALNGLVFVLIGLQLPVVLGGLAGYRIQDLVLSGLLFSLLVIGLRLAWVFPGAYSAAWLRRTLLGQKESPPPAKQVFVVAWTGMRGVVALAAALALPETLPNGAAFPQRDLILFFTFVVIVVTLVGQGLTLPLLIRRLGLAGVAGPDCEEPEARRLMTVAALETLKELEQEDGPEYRKLYSDITHRYEHELSILRHGEGNEEEQHRSVFHARGLALEQALFHAQRSTAIKLRDEGRINDELLRRLEHELDLDEERLLTHQQHHKVR